MLQEIVYLLLMFLILFFIIFFLYSSLVSAFFGAPFVDTHTNLISSIVSMLDPKKNDTFYDLGCGSGKIVEALAQCRVKSAIGFEISPLAYILAKIRVNKYHNAQILFKNFNKIDFSTPSIVYCYLLPKPMQFVAKQFINKLRPGSKLVCQDFPIKNKKAIKTHKVGRHILYLYRY